MGKKLPSGTSFKQQKLRACTPILTPIPVIVTFFITGAIFIPVGVVLLLQSQDVEEYIYRYDGTCGSGTDCRVFFSLKNKMKKPVFLYYGLSNYNQNHRRYVKSRQDDQLAGQNVNSAADREKCDPITYLNDDADSNNFLFPCGLVAKSTFNDTFTLSKTDGTPILLSTDNIAWQSDLDQLFSDDIDVTGPLLIPNVPGCTDPNNCSFRDPDFVVWMRVAALPTFRKLYRVINQDLSAGNYTMDIANVYPVEEFDGEKRFILSTSSWIGGKNDFLGIAYLVVGSFSLIMSVIFLIKHLLSPRKFGDVSLIEWMDVAEDDRSSSHS